MAQTAHRTARIALRLTRGSRTVAQEVLPHGVTAAVTSSIGGGPARHRAARVIEDPGVARRGDAGTANFSL